MGAKVWLMASGAALILIGILIRWKAARYDLKDAVSLERINEWNGTQRFGRAFLDKEKDPILQMDLDLDDGGISQLLFIDNIEFWTSVLGKFEQHIGYRK